MPGQTSQYNKIDRRLVGPPATFGDRQIQPVAQLTGWQWSSRQGNSTGGALVQLHPVAFLIHEHGATRTIPVLDPQRLPVAGLAWIAAVVMVLCWIVMGSARRWTQAR
jgi:hypothetical protein